MFLYMLNGIVRPGNYSTSLKYVYFIGTLVLKVSKSLSHIMICCTVYLVYMFEDLNICLWLALSRLGVDSFVSKIFCK